MQRQRPVQKALPMTVREAARTEVALAQQISTINAERASQHHSGPTLRKVAISVQAIKSTVRNLIEQKASSAEALTKDRQSEGKNGQTLTPQNVARKLDTRHPPRFTEEESIVMRAFAAGKSIKQICSELRIPQPLFCRLLRDLMEKTSTSGQTGLLSWALSHKPLAAASARS
jgi:DNA-binding NarL/FixJ family response regulator